jgi:hypothetical protein
MSTAKVLELVPHTGAVTTSVSFKSNIVDSALIVFTVD